ncbi:FAD-binding protein [Candidatus Bathyarchaeota archaeon]|nr:FAD-binding protein [Candidatus Bathyarchaeota archaeon]
MGIVGWFTGGGHGFLSSTYGMGSDNVLEATVVLLNGTVVTTNTCSHPDLFYAIRGGGGGTYGIITSVVMKAYPSPKTTSWLLTVTLQDPSMETEWWDLMAGFSGGLKALKDGGVQGYYFMFGPPVMPTMMLLAAFNLFDKPEGTVDELFGPFKERLDAVGGAVEYDSNVTTVSSYLESYGGDVENEPVASNIALGSWLLPAEAFEDAEALSAVYREIGPTMNPTKVRVNFSETPTPHCMGEAKRTDQTKMPGSVIIGHLVANSDNRDLDTALNPAWRDAVSHVVLGGGWPEGASDEEIQAFRDDVTYRQVAALKSLAPDSGAYFNEVSVPLLRGV